MKKEWKGSITVEAAVIAPLILGVFVVIVWILFYFHDKNVIAAVSHESVLLMYEQEGIEAEQVEEYFQKRIRGKLILFSGVQTEVQIDSDAVHMISTSKKNGMSLRVEMGMKRTNPENYIRNIRRIGAIK